MGGPSSMEDLATDTPAPCAASSPGWHNSAHKAPLTTHPSPLSRWDNSWTTVAQRCHHGSHPDSPCRLFQRVVVLGISSRSCIRPFPMIQWHHGDTNRQHWRRHHPDHREVTQQQNPVLPPCHSMTPHSGERRDHGCRWISHPHTSGNLSTLRCRGTCRVMDIS